MSNRIYLNDKIASRDAIVGSHKPGIWARTQIIGGYGRTTDKSGVSQLGEVVFEQENMVLIGGVQYVFERLFNVTGPLTTGYLNDSGIGSSATTPISSSIVYPADHAIYLFGVGTGGAGTNTTSAADVDYKEKGLVAQVPFRYTSEALSPLDAAKYFGKKVIDNKTAYYLKTFDSKPEIKHLWLDAEGGQDGSEVDSSVFGSSRTDAIESFVEILLTISSADLKEWFTEKGSIEETRVNEIGLFCGSINSSTGDYERIKCFSKLNIPTEPLSLSKDLEIIYRVFGS